jgi:hypothetical protein
MSTENQQGGKNTYLSTITTIILCINVFFLFKYLEFQKELKKIKEEFGISAETDSGDSFDWKDMPATSIPYEDAAPVVADTAAPAIDYPDYTSPSEIDSIGY